MPVTQKKDATKTGSKTRVSNNTCAVAGVNPPELVGIMCSIKPYRTCKAGPEMSMLSIATATILRAS